MKANWEWYIDKSYDGSTSFHRTVVGFVVLVAACSFCFFLYRRAAQKAEEKRKAEAEAKRKAEAEAKRKAVAKAKRKAEAAFLAQCVQRGA